MPKSTLTKIPIIEQKFFGKKTNDAPLFNLKPIKKKIEQATKKVTDWKPYRNDNFVTCAITTVDHQFVELAIRVTRGSGPENGSSHKPRRPPPTLIFQ